MGDGVRRARIARMLDEAQAASMCVMSNDESDCRAMLDLVKSGELVAPTKGMFARTLHWESLSAQARVLHMMRALHVVHPAWVFCGSSAAVAHGLWTSNRMLCCVHIAQQHGSCGRSVRGIARHELRRIERESGLSLPVTSLHQTVMDCARWGGFGEGLAAADSAMRFYGLEKSALEAYVAANGRRLHGVGDARRAVEHADARSENGGESLARAACIACGFAVPELQVSVVDPVDSRRSYRVDFLWHTEDGRVIAGEYDGLQKLHDDRYTHGRSALRVLQDERLRESRLTACVDAVIRFSYQDICDYERFTCLLNSFGVPCA